MVAFFIFDGVTLQTSHYQFSYFIKNMINHFLSNSVVSAGIVVSGIFFASHQLVWVKQLSVFAATNLV